MSYSQHRMYMTYRRHVCHICTVQYIYDIIQRDIPCTQRRIRVAYTQHARFSILVLNTISTVQCTNEVAKICHYPYAKRAQSNQHTPAQPFPAYTGIRVISSTHRHTHDQHRLAHIYTQHTPAYTCLASTSIHMPSIHWHMYVYHILAYTCLAYTGIHMASIQLQRHTHAAILHRHTHPQHIPAYTSLAYTGIHMTTARQYTHAQYSMVDAWLAYTTSIGNFPGRPR